MHFKAQASMINQVEENSIAHELGIRPGDRLISINGHMVKDVFDFRYLQKDEYLNVVVEKPDGEEWELEIEKDEDEELGLVFDNGLMDKPMSCRNNCIFCFIDQLPGGMRQTLYFKDDDVRLGFLQGNYVTLTNICDSELDRIIYYHLSPVNISVHATDPKVRVHMLKNPSASKIISQIEKLGNAGLEMNFQIVVCKGINDGAVLDETIAALSKYIPRARSLSVVPVGLSKYRNGLFKLEPFTSKDAAEILRQVELWQQKLKKQYDVAFVFAADEFYLLAGRTLPPVADYEGFPQIENGVGMLALFSDEFRRALNRRRREPRKHKQTVVTGMAAFNFLSGLVYTAKGRFQALDVQVAPVLNKYFGSSITVSGLLTGRDIIDTLKGHDLGSRVLIPRNALRAGDSVLLDDMDVRELGQALNVTVKAVNTTGSCFLEALY